MEKKDTRWFINNRKAQFDCAKDITGVFGNVVVDADVKCGKREIVICCALLKNKESKHIYLVNLTAKDTKEQLRQLNSYGISTYVGKIMRTHLESIKREIEDAINKGLTIYLHVDESDYGSGTKQCLSDLLRFTQNLPSINHIFYSATSFEVLYSQMNYRVVEFVPDASFKGAEYFINNGLVHKAEEPFFIFNDKEQLVLSTQGEECCKLIDIKQGKNIGVVRITTSLNKQSLYQSVKNNYGMTNSTVRKSLDKTFGKNNYVVKFTDKDSSMFWGDRDSNSTSMTAWYDLPTNKPVLHIINQTCKRSTEWALQPYLAFYHSYRKQSFATTVCQADARCFGYRDCTCKIYTSDPDAFAIPANNEDYLAELIFENGTKISQRVKSRGGVGKSGRAKKGSYDLVLLYEKTTEGLEIYEADDPIHRKGRGNPSIRYQGHRYGICNKISTWGSEETKNRSNLARFIADEIMAFSQSNVDAFGWIDKPSIDRPDWKEDFDRLYDLDPRIKEHHDQGLRVFAIYKMKTQSVISTKDNSIYSEFTDKEDLFTE